MRTLSEGSVQFNSKIGGDWVEGLDLFGVIYLELTLGLSVLWMKGSRHCFSMAELQSPGMDVRIDYGHNLAMSPFQLLQFAR